MTERLCHRSNENITRHGVPSPELINFYRRWGEGGIGVIVQGNTMIQYCAVEALGSPILCDDHDGRMQKYRSWPGWRRHMGVCSLRS
jgi:2,4-dienoyl-CoA reductase-like NADH-dependent reductase (Old Yellow Enzyme family)